MDYRPEVEKFLKRPDVKNVIDSLVEFATKWYEDSLEDELPKIFRDIVTKAVLFGTHVGPSRR